MIKQCPKGSKEVMGDFFEDGRDNEGLNGNRSFKDREEGAYVRERTYKT